MALGAIVGIGIWVGDFQSDWALLGACAAILAFFIGYAAWLPAQQPHDEEDREQEDWSSDPSAALPVVRRNGTERFTLADRALDADLLSFWQWGFSDLVSNTSRGVVAEYIVTLALGIAKGNLRKAWDAYDLLLDDGTKIEVKSAAYVQSWKQEQHSAIQFGVPKRRGWDAQTGKMTVEARRHADIYVFALLHHQDRGTIDPMDLDQWEFYVAPTYLLDERERSQHSITLSSLKPLAGDAVGYGELSNAVLSAAARQRGRLVGLSNTSDQVAGSQMQTT